MSEEIVFKVGDRVALKSGGPVMTIECFNEGCFVYCKWFGATTTRWKSLRYKPKLHQSDFNTQAIVKV